MSTIDELILRAKTKRQSETVTMREVLQALENIRDEHAAELASAKADLGLVATVGRMALDGYIDIRKVYILERVRELVKKINAGTLDLASEEAKELVRGIEHYMAEKAKEAQP